MLCALDVVVHTTATATREGDVLKESGVVVTPKPERVDADTVCANVVAAVVAVVVAAAKVQNEVAVVAAEERSRRGGGSRRAEGINVVLGVDVRLIPRFQLLHQLASSE